MKILQDENMSAQEKISVDKPTQSEMNSSSSKSRTDNTADTGLAFCVDDLMKKVDRMLTKLDTIDKLEENIAKNDRKTSPACDITKVDSTQISNEHNQSLVWLKVPVQTRQYLVILGTIRQKHENDLYICRHSKKNIQYTTDMNKKYLVHHCGNCVLRSLSLTCQE